jgi:hypothetical protein
LQAHLTVLEGKSRGNGLTLHNTKQRVTSVLKKFILAVNANLPAQSDSLLGFVRFGLRSGLERAQIWQKGARDAHHREEPGRLVNKVDARDVG